MEAGLIDRDQLTSALAYQRQWGHRLGASLVAKGFITEGTLTQALSHALAIPMVDLSQMTPDREALKVIPVALAEQHEMVPLALEGSKGRRTLVVAMADPLNLSAVEQVEFITGCKLKLVIAAGSSVGQAIRAWMRHERVVVEPVRFGRPGEASSAEPEARDEEPMTLVRAGGQETLTVRSDGTSGPLQPPPPPALAPVPVSLPNMSAPPPSMAPGWGPPMSNPGIPGPPTMPLQGQVVGAGPLPPGYSPYPPPPPAPGPAALPPGYVAVPTPQLPLPQDPVEELERKFWALMRVLARKGLITKDEFLKEWQNMG